MTALIDDAELSDDAITREFRIWQRRRGHRYSIDDVATAWQAARAQPNAQRYLDLGCGIGSVLLMVSWKLDHALVVGIEAQPVSAALARRNLAHTIIGPGGMNNEPGGAHEIKMLPRAEYVKNMWITRADTAAAAIEALTNPGAANKAFSIVNGSGPETGAWKQAFAKMPAK